MRKKMSAFTSILLSLILILNNTLIVFAEDSLEINYLSAEGYVNNVAISWITNLPANSIVEYGTTENFGSTYNTPNYTNEHLIIIDNLLPETLYYYKVKSECNGEIIESEIYTFSTQPNFYDDFIGFPLINNINPYVTEISWDTTEKSYGYEIIYGTDENSLNSSVNSDYWDLDEYPSNHKNKLSYLEPNTKYFFRIKQYTQSETNILSKLYTFTTLPHNDEFNFMRVPEVLEYTFNSADIEWGLNKESVYNKILYGETPDNLVNVIENTNIGFEQFINLSNLNDGTKYYYKVICETSSGEVLTSDIYSFKTETKAKILIGPEIIELTKNSVKIKWTTNISTYDNEIVYGTSEDQLENYEYAFSETEHMIELTGLELNTTYFYRINGSSGYSDSFESDIFSFTTLKDDTEINFVYEPYLENITNNSVEILWETNLKTDKNYINYGTASDLLTETIVNNDTDFNHLIELKDLEEGTTYYYEVVSETSGGSKIVSSINSFKTKIQPKIVSEPTVTAIKSHSVDISWLTNIETNNNLVKYGKSPDSLIFEETNIFSNTNHTISLSNLDSNTTYYFEVRSENEDGLFTKSEIGSFITKDILQIIQEPNSVDITDTYAYIIWSTNILTNNNYVKYGTSSDSLNTIKSNYKTDDDHKIMLDNLKENTTYYFEVGNETEDGLQVISGISNFKTKKLPRIVSSPKCVNLSTSFAEISWETNVETVDNYINYGKNPDKLDKSEHNEILSTSHLIDLNDLEDGTKYYYEVVSRTEYGSYTKSDIVSFTTKQQPEFINVPTTENFSNSVEISWSNNVELSSYYIKYGKNEDSLLTIKTGSGIGTNHSMYLDSLEIDTNYYFKVGGTSIEGISFESLVYTFKTEDLKIINGSIKSTISYESVIISWETNYETSINYINYSEKDSIFSNMESDNELGKFHSIKLDNLYINNEYYFSVTSETNDGDKVWESNQSFIAKPYMNSSNTYKISNENLIDIVTGSNFTVALKKDKTVIAWGDNEFGQCNVPDNLTNVKQISAGYNHVLALKEDGTVVAWGINREEINVPYGLSNVKEVAVGSSYSAALKEDGSIVVWGSLDSINNVPEEAFDIKTISAGGSHILALKEDGTVIAWGKSYFGETKVPDDLTNVDSIAAGTMFSLALKKDGSIVTWGRDNGLYGLDLTDVKDIYAGGDLILTIEEDGTITAYGYNHFGECDIPSGLENVKKLSTAGSHVVALTETEEFISWGRNNYSQCNLVSNLEKAKSVTTGQGHTVVLDKGGEIKAWGYNEDEQCNVPNGLKNVKSISASYSNTVALKEDGSIIAWGDNSFGQCDIPENITGIKSIASSKYNTVALKEDGTVVIWGSNINGLSDKTNVKAIAAGGEYILALKEDGTLIEGGRNFNKSKMPEGLKNVKSISVGLNHAVALKEDGTVIAWGSNWHGQCDVPEGLNDVKSISAGSYHTVALKEDGTIVAWGNNWHGQCDIPMGLNDVKEISAGGCHTVALEEDGNVIAWGDNSNNQSNVNIHDPDKDIINRLVLNIEAPESYDIYNYMNPVFEVKISITNNSDKVAKNVVLNFDMTDGLSFPDWATQDKEVNIGDVLPNETKEHIWTVKIYMFDSGSYVAVKVDSICDNFPNEVAAKYIPVYIDEIEKQLEENGVSDVSEGTSKLSDDPVNLANGNFISRKEDITINGFSPISFVRFYNSKDNWNGVLGSRWQNNYEIKLDSYDNGRIGIRFDDGHLETFTKDDNGQYISKSGNYNKLDLDDDQYILTLESKTKYYFNSNGYLELIKDINGNETNIIFEDDRISKIQNECGYLSFEYNDSNLISKITDNAGRAVEYCYADNKLINVKDVDGNISEYTYDEKGRLYKAIDPLNNVKVVNIYDDQNRTIDQTMGDGTKNLFNYDDENKITTLTERNGAEIVYKRDSENRIYETVYINGSEKSVFNEKNQTTSFTDKNGNTYFYEYDEKGNISKETDPLGNVSTYVYDKNNRITSITNPNGSIYNYTYDSKGNMIKAIDPLNREIDMEYNTKGLPEKVTLANGSFSKIVYDDRGNPIKTIDTEGNVTLYTYDKLNRITSITKPEGNKTELKYTAKGKISKVTNPDGSNNTATYDKRGYLTKFVDENGNETNYKYDTLGRLLEEKDSLGNITKYEIDSMGNVSEIVLPNGGIEKYNYNNVNQLESYIDAESNITKFEYDLNDNITKVIDPNGNVESYNYDGLNRLTKVNNANNAVTQLEYTYDGKIKKSIDALNNVTEYEYDLVGQLISVKNALGGVQKYSYNSLGLVDTYTDEKGKKTKYKYNSNGNVIKTTYPDGSIEKFKYDKNGNLTKVIDPKGITTKYFYDNRDRLVKIINPDSGSKIITYSETGKVTSLKDENGKVTSYKYNARDELVETINPDGNSTKYKYDSLGNLTEVYQYRNLTQDNIDNMHLNKKNNSYSTYENELITKYEYDKRGLLIKEVNPANKIKLYEYDSNGNLISKTDEDSYITKFEYDAVNNLNKINYNNEKTVDFNHDLNNQVTKIDDWLGTTNYELDALGRVLKVKDYEDKVVEYSWSSTGERESIKYPDNSLVNYEYDSMGRLIKVKDSNNGITSYKYDIAGNLIKKILPNKVKTTYDYNDNSLLASMKNYNTKGKILDNFNYEYDSVGNRIKIVRNKKITEYDYDNLNQLVEVHNPNKTTNKYFYDSLGNRLRLESWKKDKFKIATDYIYDEQGKLTKVVENSFNENHNNWYEKTKDIHNNHKDLYEFDKKDKLKKNGKFNLQEIIKLPEVNSKCSSNEDLINNHLKNSKDLNFEYDNRGNLIKTTQNNKTVNEYAFDATNMLVNVKDTKGNETIFSYNGLGKRVGVKYDPNKGKKQTEKNYVLDLTKQYDNILMVYNNNGVVEKYTY
ncbi:MAG: fibronectin type III domain-containing protein, partial [Clostridiales bacterium]